MQYHKRMTQHKDEYWQVFDSLGRPVPGKGLRPEAFTAEHLLGAAHVWLWRIVDGELQVMLQKRAATKRTWPGYYDISSAGHINLGETPIEAAVRETQEELGVALSPENMHFICTLWTPLAKNELDVVYHCSLPADAAIRFDDGEVELIEWVGIAELERRYQQPEEYHMIDQGAAYIELVLSALRQIEAN